MNTHEMLYEKWLSYSELDSATRAELESIASDKNEIKLTDIQYVEYQTVYNAL